MTGELRPQTDDRAQLAMAMLLMGHGTLADLRELDIPCEARDLARVVQAMPGLEMRCLPSGFEGADADRVLEDALPQILRRWPDLARRVAAMLCERGLFRRAGLILGELMGQLDVSAVVFRHAFDLLNVGHGELVESIVFDEAFDGTSWLKDALSAVEGLLWSGCRGYGQARERGAQLLRRLDGEDAAGVPEGERVPRAQARALVGLYGSWGDPIAPADEPPADGGYGADDALVRCLWVLRRSRQLIACGRLGQALRLVEASLGLVEEDSVVGAHLACDRFVCRALLGEDVDEADRRRLRRARDFLEAQGMDLLALSVDGYGAAVRSFVGVDRSLGALTELVERCQAHPDPLLRGALALGCAALHYKKHSFYAALGQVRDFQLNLDYMGSTDLVCCAYVLEVLCQGAVGEEPLPLRDPEANRPSTLGILPLARAAYAVALDVFKVVEAIDPVTLGGIFEDVPPSFVARTLTELALRGSWPQALALKRLLPAAWRGVAEERPEPGDDAAGEGAPLSLVAGAPAPGDSEGSDGGTPSPAGEAGSPRALEPTGRVRPLGVPKLTIQMLGTFEVRVGERKLGEDQWRRKAGKNLLAALVVAPSHRLSRAELCDTLWPDRDYTLSRNSLYSVLSSVRDALGCVDREPPYIVCDQGMVALNAKLVECDVDVFERRCREVLSREGDRPWRLSLCRHLGRLYGSGLFVPVQDVRGEFQARRQALESLYVDMLVEAADLSLQAGLAKEALWFAHDACDRGPLREDAVSCHLRALAADGRGHELDGAYRQYCTDLSDGLYMAPSARMRTLYTDLKRYMERAEEGGELSLEAA